MRRGRPGVGDRVKRQRSKPRARASARIRSSRSEVEIVIMLGGREARPAVRQQRPETRPGFQLHVPGLHRGEVTPGHIAQIVDDGKVRRRPEIGQRQPASRQPLALLQQLVDVEQMIAQAVAALAQVGKAPARPAPAAAFPSSRAAGSCWPRTRTCARTTGSGAASRPARRGRGPAGRARGGFLQVVEDGPGLAQHQLALFARLDQDGEYAGGGSAPSATWAAPSSGPAPRRTPAASRQHQANLARGGSSGKWWRVRSTLMSTKARGGRIVAPTEPATR